MGHVTCRPAALSPRGMTLFSFMQGSCKVLEVLEFEFLKFKSWKTGRYI